MDWFCFILISTVLSGINSFLFKGTAIKKINKFYISAAYAYVQFGLTFLLFLFTKPNFSNLAITIVFAIIISIGFYLRLICDLKAFEYIPTNILLPVSSLNVLVVVMFGYFFLNEKIKLLQFIGIFILLISVILINRQAKKKSNNIDSIMNLKKGLLFGFLGIIPSSAANIFNKLAVTYVDMKLLSTCVLFFIVIISSTIYFTKYKEEHRSLTKEHKKEVLKYSCIIGVFAFVAYIAYLNSLRIGPLSLIMAISVSSIIITVLLSAWKYKEELNWARMVYILFAVAGVALIRI